MSGGSGGSGGGIATVVAATIGGGGDKIAVAAAATIGGGGDERWKRRQSVTASAVGLRRRQWR